MFRDFQNSDFLDITLQRLTTPSAYDYLSARAWGRPAWNQLLGEVENFVGLI